MLVLDEQLMGRDLETTLGHWYRGSICFINDLRPGTVIKDDAIPSLLRKQSDAIFLTINETDFWRNVTMDHRFCIMCFALPDSRVREIPELLRAIFRHPAFRTKAHRNGKVLRITQTTIRYYTYLDEEIQTVMLPR